jgi:hypothetical protein
MAEGQMRGGLLRGAPTGCRRGVETQSYFSVGDAELLQRLKFAEATTERNPD